MKINIIPYRNEHQPLFKQLNLEWLDQYNLTEHRDRQMLDDPKGTILDLGGYIWIAEVDGQSVGSAALIKEHDGVYELAKMSVADAHRGQGISNFLIEKCINKAREIGARKISLFSNHNLKAAIGLYEKYGFEHVPLVDSPFETADVKMELVLG